LSSTTDASPDPGSGSPGRLLVDEPAPGVARLTISHPARRGALDHAILDAFVSVLDGLDARCVIVTGEDATFSAGYDLGGLPASALPEEAEKLVARPFTAALEAVQGYPHPTVAALNGHAVGGGLELALACDLRLTTAGARFGMPPAKLGLVYSHTGIRSFIDVIGAARTRELFLVGGRIDAATALAWGLVGGLHEDPAALADAALDLAGEIASNAPLAQAGNKQVIRAVLDARAQLDADVERELLALRSASFRSEDFGEGVRAFAEKRAPQWQAR
jgi:enoyl-CoA hydratase/carnithine racemase